MINAKLLLAFGALSAVGGSAHAGVIAAWDFQTTANGGTAAAASPASPKAYVANFGAGFVGLRGSAQETAAIAKHFKVYYNKVPGKTPTSYTMDHTAGSYVFDAGGRVRLFTRHGTGPEALVHDLKILLAEKPAS